MKSKSVSRKKKAPAAKAKGKPAKKPAAKAPAKTAAAKAAPTPAPRPVPYTPKPIEGIGWAPFRYTR